MNEGEKEKKILSFFLFVKCRKKNVWTEKSFFFFVPLQQQQQILLLVICELEEKKIRRKKNYIYKLRKRNEKN